MMLHACPVRCRHVWPPGKAPEEHCQIGQKELVCGNIFTKQPISNQYMRGLSRKQQEVHYLLLLGPGTGQTRHRSLPGSSQGRRAASQSCVGTPCSWCCSISTEIQLVIQELYRTTHSQSTGQEILSTFERITFLISPWLESVVRQLIRYNREKNFRSKVPNN